MWTILIALFVAAGQFGQSSAGELRVSVHDSGGLPVQCGVMLVSEANDISWQLQTGLDGVALAKRLPFGTYHVVVNQPGFAPYDAFAAIDSVVPRDYRITLTPAALQAEVTVRAGETLLDTHQISAVNSLGADTLQQRITTLPGRSLSDVVNTQPGWLLEVGVLPAGFQIPDGTDVWTMQSRP